MNVPSPRTEALLALEAQDYEAAARSCRLGLYRTPEQLELRLILAHAYCGMGKPSDALATLEVAARHEPKARVLLLLAALRCRCGDLSGAIQATRDALGIEPRQVSLHFNLASYLSMQGEVTAAIQTYQDLLRWAPDCVQAHSNLGGLLSSLGDPEGAIVSFKRAHKLCPDQPALALNLAREWARKGDLAEAEATLRTFPQEDLVWPEIHALRVWIQEQREQLR